MERADRSPASPLVRRPAVITVLACSAWILLVCGGIGAALERWLLGGRPHLVSATLTGMVATATLASWLSLLVPLGSWLTAVLSAAGLAGWCVHGRPELPRTPILVSLAAGAGSAAYLAAGAPLVYDTGFYHAQAVRWLNEYPAVPGLANLHGRLAFNSSWFVWAAAWDHGLLDAGSYHVANTTFWIAGWALFLQAAMRLRGTLRAGDLVQASVIFPLCRFEHYTASLSPELPAHVLLVYAFSLLARVPACGASAFKRLVLTAAFLPTLKLSMAPVLLLLPAAAWLCPEVRTSATRTVPAVLALVTGPFLARNVVLSGYLLFPFERLDLFTLDWKAPTAEVSRLRLEVRGWAIEPWAGPAAALRPVREWLGPWLTRNLSRHPLEMVLLATAPVGAVFAATRGRASLVATGLALLGVVYWFAAAPDVRFGFAWMLLATLLPAAALLEGRRAPGWLPAAAVITASLWTGVLALRWAQPAGAWAPRRLPAAHMREEYLPGGQPVGIPAVGDRAWNAPLPNTPELNPRLRLRGHSLRSGFRLE